MGKLARREGAPDGNMNAVARHNRWRVWLRRRALHSSDSVWLRPLLEQYAVELYSDNPEPSAGHRRLIELATVTRGALCLALQAISTRPAESTTAELMPLLATVTRLVQAERSVLAEIGLDRKARKADDVLALLSAPSEPHPEDAQLVAAAPAA
jgi:hypothetical protein